MRPEIREKREGKTTREYVHQELGKELEVPAGYYTLFEELKLKHKGKEALCVTGVGVVECSCCAGFSIAGGSGGTYALVPGYLVSWKSRKNASGLPISDVEPIINDVERREIAKKIREIEYVGNIEFW